MRRVRVPSPVEPDTYRAALVRAAELLGGATPLSRRLHVPMSDLTRWPSPARPDKTLER